MSVVDPADPVFVRHRGGKLAVTSTVPLASREDLSLAYTPGVARVCEAIAADESLVYSYTWVRNTVAVVTDGSAVLGLGNIGPRAALPVMEGKAALFKLGRDEGVVDQLPKDRDLRWAVDSPRGGECIAHAEAHTEMFCTNDFHILCDTKHVTTPMLVCSKHMLT